MTAECSGTRGRVVRALWLAVLPIWGCAAPTFERFEFEQPAMGTLFRIVLHARSAEQAQHGAGAAFERIRELERSLSDYDPQSELSRLGRRSQAGAPTPSIALSPDLLDILTRAERIARQSGGAFDPTLGPFVQLWRRSLRQGELPSEARLAAAREASGIEKLALEPGTGSVRLLARGMRLDLGGIGKGFACDEALELLARRGLPMALVEGGGDLAVGAAPPGELGWTVAIAARSDDDEPTHSALSLSHAAVATSGDRYAFLDIDGRRFSHVVDPATGLGLERRVAATVVANGAFAATRADAWATALSVLTPADGIEHVEALDGIEALIIELDPRADEPPVRHASSGFTALRLASLGGMGGS